MRLVSIDHGLPFRDLRGLNILFLHIIHLFLAQYCAVEKQVTETLSLVFLGFLLQFYIGAVVVTHYPRENGVLSEIIETSSTVFVH